MSRSKTAKLGHVRFLPLSDLRPSPENDTLYRPVIQTDPEIIALAQSIRENGVKEPLVVTKDRFILSGHRRYAASRLAGLHEVPVRTEPIRRTDDPDQFLVLLREYNRQREKSFDEKLREELLTLNPEDAYCSLIEHRRASSRVDVEPIVIQGKKRRSSISPAKRPFLDAILRILKKQQPYWPLTDRRIHYSLLNEPPLKHASKPWSIYDNTLQSYKSLCELLTRARLQGFIAANAIDDETRPVTVWQVHREPRTFIRGEMHQFMKGYWRDLMQSQPNHIEILGEKNTVDPILRPVAMQYCIPMTTGRGYCSLPPRQKLADRYRKSGKEKLVLLMLSDFDPDGEEIAHSFARSMRDDFGIENIHPIKVSLTGEQIQQYKLPPKMKAKTTSVHHKKFTERHGDNVFELEALEPDVLQTILRGSIDSVIDLEAFNAELDAERNDAAYLEGVRRTIGDTLATMDWDEEDA